MAPGGRLHAENVFEDLGKGMKHRRLALRDARGQDIEE